MRSGTISYLIVLAGCAASTPVKRATLLSEDHERRIPYKYTVSLRDGYTFEQHMEHTGANLTNFPHFYSFNSYHGYMAEITDSKLLHDVIRMDPGVVSVDCHKESPRSIPEEEETEEHVEASDMLELRDIDNTTVLEKREALTKFDYHRQWLSVWNLQVIGASDKLHQVTYNKNKLGELYDYMDGAGLGVDVYVLDSGVYFAHPYFEGRASNLDGAYELAKSPYVDEDWRDGTGHGTKMAGIIASKWFGVAPSATIISLKVRGKDMSSENTARAIEDVTKRHNLRLKQPGDSAVPFRGSVISMSFETDPSDRLRNAIAAAKKAGINIVASAGNAREDNDIHKLYPCGYHDNVECVGAINDQYALWEDSNWGSDIGWLAPGVGIWTLSNDPSKKAGLVTSTGTSPATAHVSGTFSIFTAWLGLANGQAKDWANREALFDKVNLYGAHAANRLINTGINNPGRRPAEPFYGAGDKPSMLHVTPFPEVPGQFYPPNQDADPKAYRPFPQFQEAPLAQ